MYLGEYFLLIFDRCHCYEFTFALETEKSAAGALLSEFLQLPTYTGEQLSIRKEVDCDGSVTVKIQKRYEEKKNLKSK